MLSHYNIRYFLLAILVLFNLTELTCFSREVQEINSYAYILQADELSDEKREAVKILKDCGRQLVILDPYFDTKTRWSKRDIEDIRSGLSGRIIVAYISIGEAEVYRHYWKKKWNKKSQRPAFIREENPDWAGNFKVNYWDPDWQEIILSDIKPIINAGFDGLFLDIVDGFEYFESDGEGGYVDYRLNEATGNSFRADMIEFVKRIRTELDRDSSKDYLIIPQNGSQLLESPLYQDLISAQAIEDLFTYGDKAQDSSHSSYILNFLTSLQSQGKSILLTEYPKKKKYTKLSKDSARANNITLLQTSRSLDKLGNSY